ncbi:MAG: glycogen synthase [Candidatus Nanopelagicales bacterium]
MLRVGILTREWPPEVYGGAGVHVSELVRELRPLADVSVHCFGGPRPDATAHAVPASFADANTALATLAVDLEMARDLHDVDVVHSHTWYANLAGHIGAMMTGAPHVLTAHSLEPSRPWKAEQLGAGFRLSSWAERAAYTDADAVIAVSTQMRGEILAAYPFLDPDRVHVVRNGIDAEQYRPDPETDLLVEAGIDLSRPYVAFVGRITRQKGIAHLLRAATRFAPGVQLVLCASAPDTPEIGAETAALVESLERTRGDVVWIQSHATRPFVRQLLSHALAFLCPSVYEPLGIVNLEAMACQCAVVASAVGGIPEVVADGDTGLLVPYDASDPAGFEHAFADAVNVLVADPARAQAMGVRGRARVVEQFGWPAVAERTCEIYRGAIAAHAGR